VGSTGDSYDKALAEAFNSLFKAELVRNKGPWKSIDDLEVAVVVAVAEYINCNHRGPHGEIGLALPVEHEDEHEPPPNPARDRPGQQPRGVGAPFGGPRRLDSSPCGDVSACLSRQSLLDGIVVPWRPLPRRIP
jgi:hypothetical protein